jgi:hypothetical protein
MEIDPSEQPGKHHAAIGINRDSLSMVTEPIIENEKHHFRRISTERGMQIEFKEHREKHRDSSWTNRNPTSNVTIALRTPDGKY